MSNGKAWYTTENIGTWYGVESDKIDLSYAKREISLKDSIKQTMNLKNRRWLSSEAAGELADELEAAYSNYDIAKSEFIQRNKDHHKAHQEYVFDLIRRAKKVVWILRGTRT